MFLSVGGKAKKTIPLIYKFVNVPYTSNNEEIPSYNALS